jgi:hypothetical protein
MNVTTDSMALGRKEVYQSSVVHENQYKLHVI